MADETDNGLTTARVILAGLSDAGMLLDRELDLVDINDAYLDLVDKDEREVRETAQAPYEAFALACHDAKEDGRNARRCVEEAKPIHVRNVEVRSISGLCCRMTLVFIPVVDGANRSIGVLVLFRDRSAEERMLTVFNNHLTAARERALDVERRVEVRTGELLVQFERIRRLALAGDSDGIVGLLRSQE